MTENDIETQNSKISDLELGIDHKISIADQIYYHLRFTTRVYSIPFNIRSCINLYLLILAGDIATNPGPTKFPCGGCYKPVAKPPRGVYCEACCYWWHIKCAAISPAKYEELSMCGECLNFHFSDSFFDNSALSENDSCVNDDIDSDDNHNIFSELFKMKQQHPKRSVGAHININNLRHKFSSLKELLQKSTVDILFV